MPEERAYTLTEIAEMAKALGLTQKNDPASTTLTAPALHGPFQGNTNQFGIFAEPGVRPQRFASLVRPRSLASLLRLNSSIYHQELLEVMTGVTASSGTNATGFCGNPPTVGQGKVCEQIYSWGKYYIKTDLNALTELGTLRHRAEVPAEILNAPPGMRNPLIPDLMYRMSDPRSQLQYELWRIGVDLGRTLEHVLVQGDTTLASTATEIGWIGEFLGLDSQIKTGYTDARPPNMTCPAMDSAVISFDAEVNGTDANGDNLVQVTTELYWALVDRANEMGMEGVEFAFLMRKEQFRAIVDQWSCQYATYRCSSSAAGQPFVNDVQDTNALRLEMMTGQYLLIDGNPVPVVFSEGILREGVGANHFKADFYLVPISWAGLPLLRLEYFPMDNQYVNEFASFITGAGGEVTTLNNGLFIAGFRSTGLCMEYHFASKMRLILETPFLAGRVDDVRFTFRAPIRNSDPSDTYFYADGGRTYNDLLHSA